MRAGVPPSVTLAKYCAKNCPVGHVPAIVKVTALDVRPSGLRTVTVAVPAVATSAAPIAAVSCVVLTKVVGRAAPFQLTVAPETKLLPVTVSVNAGLPAATLDGLIAAIAGPGTPAPVATRHTPRP